ncbi:aggrecan core protein-like protein, partial [Leptotrombidium deliense]
MVIIGSLEENEYVKNLTKPGKWFFLNAKRVSKGRLEFKTTDNQPLTYFNWKANQPDDLNIESRACVQISDDGSWVDHDCTDNSMLILCQ